MGFNADCEAFWEVEQKNKNWSSKKEHKENALALGADERRGKLRKLREAQTAIDPEISEWGKPT